MTSIDDVPEHDELLRRYTPRLRYDSNEQYFADSPAQWTENPGNELRRTGGDLIARAPELTLGLLGATAYSDGRKVEKGDFIGDPKRDYRRQYVALRVARPELKNRVYGRAVEAGARLWLQYWLWYFYNDYSLALGAGLHEGDWEMVQFRMHGNEPDLAVYAQHTHAEKRPWREVKTLDGAPLVYVARGSHASYFESGFHTTEAWYDLADGKRESPPLTLEILEGDGPGWVQWTGRWGDTQPRLPGGLHQPSPTGPGVKKQWRNPDSLLDEARTPERREAPEAPEVTVARFGESMRIDFDFERHDPPPRSLVVTVNSGDEAGVPPRTYTFTLEDTASAGSTPASRPTRPSTTTSTPARRGATRRFRRSRRSPSSRLSVRARRGRRCRRSWRSASRGCWLGCGGICGVRGERGGRQRRLVRRGPEGVRHGRNRGVCDVRSNNSDEHRTPGRKHRPAGTSLRHLPPLTCATLTAAATS